MTNRSYVLVAVETAHIQSYIFASNRLKENVGASYLVAAATDRWAREVLRDMGIRSNVTLNEDEPFTNQRIKEDKLDAEALYSGGGTIVLLFAETGFPADEIKENQLPASALSRQFIRHLSRRIQEQAPGLKLTFAATPFEWTQSLSKTVGILLQDMKKQRSYQPALHGDAGLGVQIMDVSTSLPAVTLEKERYVEDDDERNPWQPYAAETIAKRNAVAAANELLRSRLNLGRTDYRFATELDDLGRTEGDTSYIAVVHADGNGLGLLIQGLKYIFPESADNRDYINYMQSFSECVKQVARAAQREMVARLLERVEEHDGKRYLVSVGSKTEAIELKQDKDGRTIFPLRPLVSGGDDVTFVCDGRIGLDLAVIFLQAFEQYTGSILGDLLYQIWDAVNKVWSRVEAALIKDGVANKRELSPLQEIINQGLAQNQMKKLTACAGIAIIKTHYPFARAYDLAEKLAGSAKQLVNDDMSSNNQLQHLEKLKRATNKSLDKYLKEYGLYKVFETLLSNLDSSALDWHITAGGLYGDLEMMREREYPDTDDGKLTLRPIFVADLPPEHSQYHRTWVAMQRIITEFQTSWHGHENKAESLRDVLRKGSLETAVYKVRYLADKHSPKLPNIAGFEKNGWDNGYCGYYDALELIDKYIPI